MNIDDWKKAGHISGLALEHGRKLIKSGVKLIDVTQSIEDFIHAQGAAPAFPINISLNNVAAHYACGIDDKKVFKKNDVVKLDVGVVYKSCIGDLACTVDISGKHIKLVTAAENALKAALELARPGVLTAEIGTAISREITTLGCKPILNLGGHELKPNILHGGTFIPNFNDKSNTRLKQGQIIAIEPFAAIKSSYITETGEPNIFSFKNPDSIYTKKLSREFVQAVNDFRFLPFCLRWINSKVPVKLWIEDLATLSDNIYGYKPLCSEMDDVVVQAEHTVMVNNPPLILTRI